VWSSASYSHLRREGLQRTLRSSRICYERNSARQATAGRVCDAAHSAHVFDLMGLVFGRSGFGTPLSRLSLGPGRS
jgi:hypothetical protein